MERFTVAGLLPKESDFATLKIVRNLQSALSLTEEEFKEFEFKQDNGNYSWNKKGAEAKEIEIGDKGKQLIKEALTKLDEEKKVTSKLFSVYEKFMIE